MANWYKPHYKIIYRLQDKTFVSRLGRYRFFSDRRVLRFLRWKKGGIGRHLRGFSLMKWYKQRYFFGLKFFNFSTRKRRKVRFFHHKNMYKVGLDRKKGFLSFFRKFDDSKVKKWFKEFYNNSNSFKILNFLRIFETRLDVLCFRLKLMPTIFLANSYIKSRGISINNTKIFAPSYLLQLGDLLHFDEPHVWRFFSNKFLKQLWKRWHRFDDLNITRKKMKYLFYRELLNKNKNILNNKLKNTSLNFSSFFDKIWLLNISKKNRSSALLSNNSKFDIRKEKTKNIFLFSVFYLKNIQFKILKKYFNLLNNIKLKKESKKYFFFYYLLFFLKNNFDKLFSKKLNKISFFYTKVYSLNNKSKKFLFQKIIKKIKNKKNSINTVKLSKWTYVSYNKSKKNLFTNFEYLAKTKTYKTHLWSIGSFFNFLKTFKNLLETLFLQFFFKQNSYRFLLLKIWYGVNKFYQNYIVFFNKLLSLLKLNFALSGLLKLKGFSKLTNLKHLLFKFFEMRFNFFTQASVILNTFQQKSLIFLQLIKIFLLPTSFYKALNHLKQSNYLYSLFLVDFKKYFKLGSFHQTLEEYDYLDKDLFLNIFLRYSTSFFKNNVSYRIACAHLKKDQFLQIIDTIYESNNISLKTISEKVLKKMCWKLQVFCYNYAVNLLQENLNTEYLLLNHHKFANNLNQNFNNFLFVGGLNEFENSNGTIDLDKWLTPNLKKVSKDFSVFHQNFEKNLYCINQKSVTNKNKKWNLHLKKYLFNKKKKINILTNYKSTLKKFFHYKLDNNMWLKRKNDKKHILNKWLLKLPLSLYSFTLNNYRLKRSLKYLPSQRLVLKTRYCSSKYFFKTFSLYRKKIYGNRFKISILNKRNLFFRKKIMTKSFRSSIKTINFMKKLKIIGIKKNWKLKKQNKLFVSYFSKLTSFSKAPLRKHDKWEKFRYLRWKLFATKYRIRFLKKKYRFIRGFKTKNFFENLSAKKFLIHWFFKKYKKYLSFFFSYLSSKKVFNIAKPIFSHRRFKKFRFSKKKSRNITLFLKNSLKKNDNYLVKKLNFIWSKRKRLKKRKRLRYSYNRNYTQKFIKKSRRQRKSISYKKYKKLQKKNLYNFISSKYQFNILNLSKEKHTNQRVKVFFHNTLLDLKTKLKLHFHLRRSIILSNEFFLFNNIITSDNYMSKKKIMKHIALYQNQSKISLLRNNFIFDSLLKTKYYNQLKYGLKKFRRSKKWWEYIKTKKISLNSKINLSSYGFLLKRSSLKRYKNFFWYRHRWHRGSLLGVTYKWRSKLLALDKIRKQRKVKFTNIRTKPLLILPSCIEFDFISFRGLMISFPNLEASLTGGSSNNYFYSLVNFYQRLGL